MEGNGLNQPALQEGVEGPCTTAVELCVQPSGFVHMSCDVEGRHGVDPYLFVRRPMAVYVLPIRFCSSESREMLLVVEEQSSLCDFINYVQGNADDGNIWGGIVILFRQEASDDNGQVKHPTRLHKAAYMTLGCFHVNELS
ncbi:hypothetical protein PoB_006358800 [Plakobranchus ocellatus]|uniref:Uncharacterized protein n=1 Tax=Plakobranchus ocellatus TaxID=259542 RepID=A0AAV4CYW2_9GAST|nr:hypothetical protein PoB_006358800 [Plakobranchus ocellatus]